MTVRAATVTETSDRILDAAMSLWTREPFDRIRLDALADRAGVAVPTIVRRFGGKAGVIVALVEREIAALASIRRARATDPTTQVIADLVDHYEAYGALILKMYAEAPLVSGLPELAARARTYHLTWCRETFADRLPPADRRTGARRIAQLTAICDATTWRILREDGGLDAVQIRTALLELVDPLLVADSV